MTAAERFATDIARHRLTVLRDDGVNRQLRFTRPDTTAMHFDLITWRGHLVFTGDMGTYVFQRLDDMFDFFRRTPQERSIDFAYWAQKCIAADTSDGIEQFSEAKFRERFTALANDFASDNDLTRAERLALLDRLAVEVFAQIEDGPHALYGATRDFEHQLDGRAVQVFPDYWEVRAMEYTPRFDWCCRAIPWAIAAYDATRVKEVVSI